MVKIESMKKIQIIIPSYNEEGNIKEIYSQLLDSFELNKNYFILVAIKTFNHFILFIIQFC